MLPASLRPASKESIKITECLRWQIQSNRLFLTVMTKQRYRGKQRCVFFSRKWEMGESIDSCKGNSSQRKNSKTLPLCFLFFSFPPSLFLCLLSKTTWANIASCHIKAIPCILQRGEFCSWMERQSSQTPNHRLHTWGVKTEKKRLFLFEPEFEPWGQTHYSTVKEVFHAITEQIDMDEMLEVVGDLNSNL